LGNHFADSDDLAESFTMMSAGAEQGRVIPVYLSIQNPRIAPQRMLDNGTLEHDAYAINRDIINTVLPKNEELFVKWVTRARMVTEEWGREKATITQAGEQVTISTTVNNVSNDRTKQEKRTPLTLELAVTPQITSDNSVIMDVEMKRQFAGAPVDPDTQAAPINTRTAKTKILVRNGQTSVIGGIYQNQDSVADNGIPLLKDLPVLGWLFRARSKTKDKNELLIFLTPRIMQQQQVAAGPGDNSAG
jgi:type IV pilus assembly protein PilQ